ncbi:MAG: cytidylate kinase-like family protein [Microgenomates group bacterium]
MKRLFELINRNLENTTLLHTDTYKNITFPMITISRERGSGGRPIAYLVAKKLGNPWQVYHKDIVDEIARETTLDPESISKLDESKSSVISELLNSIFGKKMLTMNSYYKHLLHILASIGSKGRAIVIGRGANFLFPNALKVRIVSDMQSREQAMMKYEHISLKEAKKQIEQSDRERNEFSISLFQHDQRKAHHYDVVIRTGPDIDVEEAADIIVHLARKKFKLK